METAYECPFCSPGLEGRAISEVGTVVAIRDRYPVTAGHTLIIPKRHTEDYFSMTAQERADAATLINDLRSRLIDEDSSIIGFNIGINCGKAAGQSIMHAHIHLIPRREGDTPNPKGGVRGVIPGRMGY